jgi:hypothetical protein
MMRQLKTLLLISIAIYASFSTAQEATEPIPEDPYAAKSLGYTSVAEALESLKAKPDVSVTVTRPDGWTIIQQKEPFAIWSFTPPSHYAYPAVVRRTLERKGSDLYMQMAALCQADKASCDKLIREFNELNERMKQSVRQQIQSNKDQR